MTKPQTFTHRDYTVGWICALPETELVAAMAMLDEHHPVLPAIDPHDSNSYVLGRISDHNVVIACLPAETTGKVSAATVARDMIRSFPAVRFGLMVGIGGGAPYYGARGNNNPVSIEEKGESEDSDDSGDDREDIRDIRLGDVVISLHSKSSDAVVQYDFGKSLQEKEFIYSGGKLNKPPSILLSAVARLKAQHVLEGHKISKTLSEMMLSYPALATKFRYPGSKKDCLFKSEIIHVEGTKSCKTCRGPLDSNLVRRKDRPVNSPRLHYGTIGSADQVIKDAFLRDKWARTENIICFEMEAAGLMDSFPCLVVRGICDYADSHKNKIWQPYSAATAASYGKELLQVISEQGVMILDPIKQIAKSIREVHDVVKDTGAAVQTLSINSRHKNIFDKLPYANGSSFDASDAEHNAICHPKTRIDLLRQISEWADNPSQECIFWLNGMAGTGKSTISRTIAHCFKSKNQLGASFFLQRGERDRGTAKKFFTTICAQLLLQIPALIPVVEKAINSDPYISEKWMKEQFNKLILQPLLTLNHSEPITFIIVIDALDECEAKDDIKAILQLLPQVQKSTSIRLRIFLTSRPDLAVRIGFKQNKFYQELILHDLPKPMIECDIRIYLEDELAKIRDERSLPSDWPGNEAIEELVRVAAPLFIFAATTCCFIKEGTHPRKRLQRFLDFQATTSASHMDKIYLPVLEQLTVNEGNNSKEILQEFRSVVGVIIVLATPLSVKSLAQLLHIPAEDVKQLLDPLHSVLSVPQGIDAPVRVLHLSFRDFLVNTTSTFRVDEEETHHRLALHCLRVMNTDLKHNIWGLPSYGTRRDDINSLAVNQHLSEDLQYSCQYWVYHLQQCKGCISESDLLSFLEKHFLHWLEALSLMGAMSEAVRMIDMLQGAVRNENPIISDFVYDARRFALKNAYIASIFPLQLYCSGLVFSPIKSTIRKIFSDDIPNQIHILPQVEDIWSPIFQTLEGRSGSVRSVAFCPDGQTLVSSSNDKTIKLWDAKTGAELQILQGHSGSVQSVAFSPNGHTLASGSDDKIIKLWDTKTGSELQTLQGHLGLVNSVAFSPDGQTLVSSSYDETIKLWDVKTGAELQALQGHSDLVNSVAFSPNGQTLASGSDDETIKLWDAKTRTELQTLQGHSDWVESMAFSPDGQTLASSSNDKTIKLWNTKTGAELQTLWGHSDWVFSVAFSPDGHTLASGSNKSIKLWDINTGAELQTLQGHSDLVNSVAFSPNGQTLASGSYDKIIKLWNTKAGTELQTLKGYLVAVQLMAFSPDGQTLASGSYNQTTKNWDAQTDVELQTFQGHPGLVQSLANSTMYAEQCTATPSTSNPHVHNNYDPTLHVFNAQVTLSDNWIAFAGKRLLWLPPEHRQYVTAAVKDTALALGYSDGRVSLIGFDTQ